MDKTKLSGMKVISFRFDTGCSPDEMLAKEYASSCNDEKPLGRTLFIAKVPLYLDKNDIKKLFSEVGRIVSVNLIKRACDEDEISDTYMNGSQSAYVVYKNRESLVKALNLVKLKTLTDENYRPIRGLQKYMEEYNDSIYNPKLLLEEATKAIQLYEKQEKENLERRKKLISKKKVQDKNVPPPKQRKLELHEEQFTKNLKEKSIK